MTAVKDHLKQRSFEIPLPGSQGGKRMETDVRSLGSLSGIETPREEPMIQEDVVREMLVGLARGEGFKRIARELGMDRKTVKA
jgi:DNA-binding NarL/FixJ family response regulator